MPLDILSDQRIGPAITGDAPDDVSWRTEFDADVDRIVFCDAFRRLQDKTQVHGPSGNDYVRSRLTHSIEVSRVGRQLGALFGRLLAARAPNLAPGRSPADFGQTVAAACLMHDIGNPPFGHTGEAAISEFFATTEIGRKVSSGLRPATAAEASKFEGNAQGLRVVTKLQGWRPNAGLGLTAAVIAAACKYPFDALSGRSAAKKGKYNFFATEAAAITQAAEATNMKPHPDGGWKRHPLAYLVEAADDISYRIVDIEDGYSMRCISFERAEALLTPIAGVDEDYTSIETPSKKIVRLRSRAIGNLILEVDRTMHLEFDRLVAGDHPGDLLLQGPSAAHLGEIERISRAEIYANHERLKNDLLAHKTLHTLLGTYLQAFLERESGTTSVFARHVLKSFPHADKVGRDKDSYVRAVLDHVSGMTDAYAVDQAELFCAPARTAA